MSPKLPEHEGLTGGQDGGEEPGGDNHQAGSPLHVGLLDCEQGPADDQISGQDSGLITQSTIT